MLKEEFSIKIKELAEELDIMLNEKQISQFYEYMNILLEWNEKINLTAITNPDEIILKHFIDSLQKRVNFLQETINKLKLTKIQAIHSRVEEFARNKEKREKFDYATSRAVANLATLSEYLIPLVKLNGKCICMKGSEINDELEKSKKAISLLGGNIEKIDTFCLPKSNIARNIILLKKERSTPNKYPRKPGMPTKEPLN